MDYFFADGDEPKGPYRKEELRAAGLNADSIVWREGLTEWHPAESLDELADLFVAPAGLDASSGALPLVYPQPADADPRPPIAEPAPSEQPAAAQTVASAPPVLADPQLAYGGYDPTTTPPTGLAVASLVLGIASMPLTLFYCVGLPCAILAIVFGHVTRSKARRGQAGGAGMALAGLLCGYFVVGIVVLIILLATIAVIRERSR